MVITHGYACKLQYQAHIQEIIYLIIYVNGHEHTLNYTCGNYVCIIYRIIKARLTDQLNPNIQLSVCHKLSTITAFTVGLLVKL